MWGMGAHSAAALEHAEVVSCPSIVWKAVGLVTTAAVLWNIHDLD